MRIGNDDRTTAARIRDAAVARFAREGFGVGLREIAEEAGVSLGLIRHHFGSKEGLRQACDEHVLGVMGRLQAERVHAKDPTASFLAQIAAVDEYVVIVEYVLRAVGEGGEFARTFLTGMIDTSREYVDAGVAAGLIKPSRDEAARVRYLTLNAIGGMMLEFAMADDRDAVQRWRRYVRDVAGVGLELYTQGLLTSGEMLEAYTAHQSETTERPPNEGERP